MQVVLIAQENLSGCCFSRLDPENIHCLVLADNITAILPLGVSCLSALQHTTK